MRRRCYVLWKPVRREANRLIRPSSRWVVLWGHRRSDDGAYSVVIKRNDLSVATATDLARALRKARQRDAEPEEMVIDTAPDDE